MLRNLPFFKILAMAQVALLVHRHLRHLTPGEWRRLRELVGHGHRLNPDERQELRALVGKLEPVAFAWSAADRVSPVRLKRRR
jgi:hypothetical protein